MLDDDSNAESDANIKVTLNTDPDPANTYRLGSSVEGVVMVTDNDRDTSIPLVSIKLDNETDSIEEGNSLEASLTAFDIIPSAETPLNVLINVSQEGNYIAFRVPRSITMTSETAPIIVRTQDDNFKEDDGKITISIERSEGDYIIDSTFPSVELAVTDNEPEDVSLIEPEDRISVASNVVNEILSFLDGPPTNTKH